MADGGLGILPHARSTLSKDAARAGANPPMAGKKSTRTPASAARPAIDTYWERTQWPLQSLLFLLPLLILYEVGAVYYASNADRLPPIVAERLLDQWFGVSGYYFPAIIVLVVLISWHVVRRDPWRIELPLYGIMAIESLVLALPLFVFALVIFREMPTAAVIDPAHPLVATAPVFSWREELVFSIGAGIYEELLFRLIGIALLHMLLVDLLALPDAWGAVGSVFGSAVAFALYHFPPFWDAAAFSHAFSAAKFAFYTFAGVYLAAVYVLRGFGIVAATHALYDVLVVMYPKLQAGWHG